MKKTIKNIISHPLFSGGALMIIGSNSINVLSYLYHLVMVNLLGPSGYGELAALISVIGLLGIVPGSLSVVIIRYISVSNSEEELKVLLFWLKDKILKFSVVFFLLIILFSPLINSFLHIDNIYYLPLIGISFLFSLSSVINRSVLQGLLKFKELIISSLAENFIKLAISVFLVFIGYKVFGAMLALVIASVIGWYLTVILLNIKGKSTKKSPSNIKDMFLFTIPVLVQSLAITLLYSSDLILVTHFFSKHEAGIYAALSTLGKIIYFGTSPISSVMFPMVSRRHARGEDHKKVFIYSFLATLFFASCAMFVYTFLPIFTINLLYKTAYLEGASLLAWFGLFITLFTLSSLVTSYNLSLGKTKVVVFSVVASIAQIIGIWFFHQSLYQVIMISVWVTALLLVCLLIYSSYGDKVVISDNTSL